jgi:hypothetical protein
VLADIGQLPAKEVINALFSAICQVDTRLRWHAVSAMGVTVARLADEEMEEGRIMLRRMLWSLNDESGGIGWGAPESMAESMHHHAGLAEEYIHMLISYTRLDGPELEQDGNFLEHETLQQGLLWGLDRLCTARKQLLVEKGFPADIPKYLASADTIVRGLAVRLCGKLGVDTELDRIRQLADDSGRVARYEDGRFFVVTVGELAGSALQELGQ